MARPGTFQPGQSGNPSGRPKADRRLQDLAREHTEAAVKALVKALDSPRERVAAAVALLDRGFGKPVQTIEGNLDVRNYVLRAPSPVESADEWLRTHVPSDSRAPLTTDG